jgi:hypothetical protein
VLFDETGAGAHAAILARPGQRFVPLAA